MATPSACEADHYARTTPAPERSSTNPGLHQTGALHMTKITERPQPRYCPSCGSEFEAWVEACLDCGTPLVAYDQSGVRHVERGDSPNEPDGCTRLELRMRRPGLVFRGPLMKGFVSLDGEVHSLPWFGSLELEVEPGNHELMVTRGLDVVEITIHAQEGRRTIVEHLPPATRVGTARLVVVQGVEIQDPRD